MVSPFIGLENVSKMMILIDSDSDSKFSPLDFSSYTETTSTQKAVSGVFGFISLIGFLKVLTFSQENVIVSILS